MPSGCSPRFSCHRSSRMPVLRDRRQSARGRASYKPRPACGSGALAAISHRRDHHTIGPGAGERGCCRFSGFTATAYPLRVLLQPHL
jgi:hypothetical protein